MVVILGRRNPEITWKLIPGRLVIPGLAVTDLAATDPPANLMALLCRHFLQYVCTVLFVIAVGDWMIVSLSVPAAERRASYKISLHRS
jgi:hypothetical protein